jgi:hypothetical protein
MNQLLIKLKQIAERKPQGFTVFLPDLTPVKAGWVVALKETQNCFGDDGLQKAYEVATKTSNVIGGWKDEGEWYWDACLLFDSEADATRAGMENEQLAIYHIETATIKWLK